MREIYTLEHPRHCRDTSYVKFLHLSLALSPVSPAPRGQSIQIIGALKIRLYWIVGNEWCHCVNGEQQRSWSDCMDAVHIMHK